MNRIKQTVMAMVLGLSFTNCATKSNIPGQPLNPLKAEKEWFEDITGDMVDTKIRGNPPNGVDRPHPPTELAVCFSLLNFVDVNMETLWMLSSKQRHILAAHEILHCQYGVPHIVGQLSVMNPYILKEDVIVMYEQQLIEEIRYLADPFVFFTTPLPPLIRIGR